MAEIKHINPDYLFEVSWEVCNKVGGIHTVISTKALSIHKELNDNYILIGPDVWKETHQNPEFTEDNYLFRRWREQAAKEGLRLKIGRWNIASNPIVILVDFTHYFVNKDEIFKEYWEKYKLDSIAGAWDYIEPAMFGYAAAKAIESFYEYNLTASDKIVAQFHEWMTGTGVLYLKDRVPQVGLIFTTHATVAGRTIAGNNLHLYRDLNQYNADLIAKNYNTTAKHSLEKLSAQACDCFTTVSEITAKECAQFLHRSPDVITPNGFEAAFVPEESDFEHKRKSARQLLEKVTSAFLNQKIDDNTIFLINSGRYEFRNKGIELFIDALGEINRNGNAGKQIVAYLTVPANNKGPKQELIDRMENTDFTNPITDFYLTHWLEGSENDPIIRRLKENKLRNLPEDKVKVIFVPCYLNGIDGIFNLNYYELLIGFDLSVFPSYYEPWGYTPLESLAFHIPTITTTLAGFGLWIRQKYGDIKNGVIIIERDDNGNEKVIKDISTFIE
nr:glycogen/starch synthase [Bacteroidales bacterium]